MRSVEHNGHEALTFLELVLRLEGEFRRSLEPIRVTPLQAGVLLFLHRHVEANMTETAVGVGVEGSTLSVVVRTLVRKRWVTSHRTPDDRRVMCVRLTQRGEALAQRIKNHVRDVRRDPTSMKEASS